MRGRQAEVEEEIQPVEERQSVKMPKRRHHLEPLRHPGVPDMRSFGDSPNQVNLKKDISKRVKNAIDGIKKNPEIISNLGKLSEYIKNSSANEVTATNKTPRANDRVKKDLTITIIKEYPEIITQLADSKSLSEFIKGLEIESSLYLKDLVKTIITDSKDSKALIEITGLTNSKELSEFIKDVNIKADHLDGSRNKIDLIKTIIKDNPKIITNLKDSEALSKFIKDLNIKADHLDGSRNKIDLIKTIIKDNPKIITNLKDSEALSKFIKDLGIKDDHEKTALVKKIIDKNSGIITNLKDSEALSKFIKDLNITNNQEKTDLVKKIIGENSGIISDLTDSKSLSGFTNELNIDNSFWLTYLVKKIIDEKSGIISDLKNSEALLGFIKDLGIEDDHEKTALVNKIIDEKSGIISDLKNSEALLGFIKDLGIEDDHEKTALVNKIIDKKSGIISDLTNSKELSEFIKDLGIEDDHEKTALVKKIIDKKSEIISDLKNSEALLGFIKDLGIETNYDKTDLLIAVIRSNPGILGENDKEKNLSNIIGNFKLHYFPNFPNLLLKIIEELPQDLNISYGRLIANIYPSDDESRKKLIFEAISLEILNKDNFLNWGFDYLKQGGLHLEIIEEAKKNNIVTNKDLFCYLEDKLPNCYESLNSVLNDKKVKDIIREEAIPNIANFIYGDNRTEEDINELKEKNATSLISFSDFFKKNEDISASLKEDSKEKLKSSFRPINPEKIISRDVKNIAILFGMDPKELRILMKKKENGGPSENDSKILVTVPSGTSVTRAHSASEGPSVTDTSAPTLPSSIPVVSVSNSAPSNSPSPGGCFQAIRNCFGR